MENGINVEELLISTPQSIDSCRIKLRVFFARMPSYACSFEFYLLIQNKSIKENKR